jgi:hypothetical protein
MSSSLFAAIAAISRFCSLVSFLIRFPLTRRRGARRNNADDFFFIPLSPSVNHKQHSTLTNRSKRDPAFLLACPFIALRQSARIIEYESGSFEPDIVFEQILSVLLSVPFEAHGWHLPLDLMVARQVLLVNTCVHTILGAKSHWRPSIPFELVVGNRAYPAGAAPLKWPPERRKNTTPGYTTGCCRAALLARLLISC